MLFLNSRPNYVHLMSNILLAIINNSKILLDIMSQNMNNNSPDSSQGDAESIKYENIGN